VDYSNFGEAQCRPFHALLEHQPDHSVEQKQTRWPRPAAMIEFSCVHVDLSVPRGSPAPSLLHGAIEELLRDGLDAINFYKVRSGVLHAGWHPIVR
jgi:hypothetical protein